MREVSLRVRCVTSLVLSIHLLPVPIHLATHSIGLLILLHDDLLLLLLGDLYLDERVRVILIEVGRAEGHLRKLLLVENLLIWF